MIQELNSVDQYCCLFHIVHQRTQMALAQQRSHRVRDSGPAPCAGQRWARAAAQAAAASLASPLLQYAAHSAGARPAVLHRGQSCGSRAQYDGAAIISYGSAAAGGCPRL
jgi:hypothetical protein